MLVSQQDACLVLFNMQLELIPLLEEGTQVLNDCCWLADVGKALGVPTIVIEHKKLGKSSQALKDVARESPYLEKIYFDCMAHEEVKRAIDATGRKQLVLAGGETHVCVLQSAVGMKRAGKDVFVISDAV